MTSRAYFRLTHAYLDADRTFRPRYLAAAARAVGDGDVAVELGCGADAAGARAMPVTCRAVGVDRDLGRLARARAGLPRASFVCADFRQLTFTPGSLTAVISCYAMIHVPSAELPALLGRISSWLAPGGLFAGSIGAACSAFRDGVPSDVTCVPAPRLAGWLAGAGLLVERHEVDCLRGGQGDVGFSWFLARRPRRARQGHPPGPAVRPRVPGHDL